MKKFIFAIMCLTVIPGFASEKPWDYFRNKTMKNWSPYQFSTAEFLPERRCCNEDFQISLPVTPEFVENVLVAVTEKELVYTTSVFPYTLDQELESYIPEEKREVIQSRNKTISGSYEEGIEIHRLFDDGVFQSTRVVRSEMFVYLLRVEFSEECEIPRKPDCAFCHKMMKERRSIKYFFNSFKLVK